MTELARTYLGDGVYATVENNMIKLTWDGVHPTNTIYMEYEVFFAFMAWVGKACPGWVTSWAAGAL